MPSTVQLDPAVDPKFAAFLDEARELIQEYGDREFKIRLADFCDCLGRINQLNQQISRLDDTDSDGYQVLAGQIVAATQEYYTYVGKSPERLRRFFLHLADISGSQEAMDRLSELTGSPIEANKLPLLSIQAIRPQSYIMQIDAITNQLAHYTGESELQVKVGKRGSQPIRTTVTLDMPDHMRIEGGGALSTYDKSIINGVTSLIESGNTVFSIPMLYHAMTGKQNPTVDEQLSDDLTAKLEKMRRMMLTIDLTEENEAHYLTDANGEELKVEDVQLEGYLLPLNKVTGKVNGKKAEMYQIIQYPPLYTYSKMKRQLASVRISLLDAPVNNNATTIPLKTYLLQRIELMKNKRNHIVSNRILYESVYTELGAQDANKTRKMRIRGYAGTILQHFVEQGYIRGYAEYKQGRSIAGIEISL